jgi:hypothetical protein
MSELTHTTCARHREALAQAAEQAIESHAAELCRVCGRPTTHRDGYGPLCPVYCEAEEMTVAVAAFMGVLAGFAVGVPVGQWWQGRCEALLRKR